MKQLFASQCICGVIAMMVLGVTGCTRLNHGGGGRDRPANGEAPAADAVSAALIRPGFVLAVKVEVQGRWEIDEAAVRVADEGFIRLPLVGSVEAAGRNLNELRDHLAALYADYFVQPQVSLDFVAGDRQGLSPWGAVTVLGRVENPGVVPLPATRTLSVIAAIQAAGGFAGSADQRNIRITRPDESTRRVNLRQMGRGGQVEEDIALGDGDIVYVPERLF